MQGTRDERDVNRPLASHGHRKPDPRLALALIEHRLTELPASSLRKQTIEQMIERVRD